MLKFRRSSLNALSRIRRALFAAPLGRFYLQLRQERNVYGVSFLNQAKLQRSGICHPVAQQRQLLLLCRFDRFDVEIEKQSIAHIPVHRLGYDCFEKFIFRQRRAG